MLKIQRLTEAEFRVEPKGTLPNGKPKTNGYFLVKGNWGTCFLRVTTTREDIDLTYNSDPKCFHTYTKIPKRICHNVYHVYCNYLTYHEVLFKTTPGSRIIGFDAPQRSGNFYNRSFLIYIPDGTLPDIQFIEGKFQEEAFHIETEEGKRILFTKETMFRSRNIQKIFLSDEDYPQTRNKENVEMYQEPATFSLSDVAPRELPEERAVSR